MKISNQIVDIIFNWLIFFLTLCCVTCTKEDNILPEDRLQKVTDSLRTALEEQLNKTVPSLSVLIQTSRNTYFACSFASGETEITPDTWFHFASNTKNFTAASILNMYEDGWLDYRLKNNRSDPRQPHTLCSCLIRLGHPQQGNHHH